MSFISGRKSRGRAATAALGAAAAAVIWTAAAAPAAADEALADLVEAVSPAVVTVLASQTVEDRGRGRGLPEGSPFEDLFRHFGPFGERFGERFGGDPFGGGGQRQGLGSGFVLDAEGYVVTNNHVVDGADAVTVRIAGRGDLPATVVGTDAATDLALLRVEATGLPHLTLGDSDRVRPGQDVFAVGNPFGLGGTVTRGIVSATQRDIQAGPYTDFIQTDAAINRGNSGGPLFNMKGEVIGVNSAIYSPNGGSVGVGFAVASNIVRQVVAQLRAHGTVDRGWLGVSIQPVTPEIAAAIGLDRAAGALVATVIEGGPSDGTLRSGDVIVGYGGRPVETSRDLPKLVGATRAGETVELRLRRAGAEVTVPVTIGRLDDDRRASLDRSEDRRAGRAASETLGATLAGLTPDARSNIGLGADVSGVVVTSLQPRGAAARAGIRVGDVILRVGDRDVANPRDLERAIAESGGETALLLVNRRGSQLWLGVRLT